MNGAALLTGDAGVRYWHHLSSGDSTGAVSVAMSLREGGTDLGDVLDGLVCAAQAEVGRRWAANEWNVAEEHRATSISEDVVSALSATVTGGGEAGTAVVSCIDGEWHSLPARVVAAILRQGGWDVHFLGASVPPDHLTHLLHDLGPDVTALSSMLPSGLFRARSMIEASRATGVPVMVGGPGFGPGGRWGLALGANGAAPDARSALDRLASPDWPRFTDPAPPLPEGDDASRQFHRHRRRLVEHAVALLAGRWPGVAAYDGRRLARTEEDLGHLVDFLAAALFVDDPGLYTGFVRWMAGILEVRGVPRPALVAGLEVTAEALASVLGARGRAESFTDEAIAAVEAGDGA